MNQIDREINEALLAEARRECAIFTAAVLTALAIAAGWASYLSFFR